MMKAPENKMETGPRSALAGSARRTVAPLLLAAGMLLFSGCLQIDTHIKLHEDGTATVTEKLRFSRRLLDLGKEGGVAELLKKEAVLERMKQMGTGITLESHTIQDAEGGSRESIAVFKVADLNGFRYASPWPGYKDFAVNNVVQFKLGPRYKSAPYANGKAGEMILSLHHLKKPVGHAKPAKDAPPPKGPTPLELQEYRDIGPVFRDILKDFKVRLWFESYAPITRSGMGVRGQRAGSKIFDFINFTDKDLDKYGGKFLENEELMLDLVRFDIGSADVVNHVRQYASNHTLPVFFPIGSRYMWWGGGTEVCFKPSRHFFDKHYAGKMLDFAQWQKSDPSKHKKATWAMIGYQPPPTKK